MNASAKRTCTWIPPKSSPSLPPTHPTEIPLSPPPMKPPGISQTTCWTSSAMRSNGAGWAGTCSRFNPGWVTSPTPYSPLSPREVTKGSPPIPKSSKCELFPRRCIRSLGDRPTKNVLMEGRDRPRGVTVSRISGEPLVEICVQEIVPQPCSMIVCQGRVLLVAMVSEGAGREGGMETVTLRRDLRAPSSGVLAASTRDRLRRHFLPVLRWR